MGFVILPRIWLVSSYR